MMLFVNKTIDYYRATVRLAHTETETGSAIVARARLEYPEDHGLGYFITRGDDMSGEKVFEVTTVTFWRD